MKLCLVNAITALLLFGSLGSPAQAAANLMVTPTRVVFDQRDRTAQVTLVNQGSESGDFRISFVRQNMTASGEFVTVAEDQDGLYSDPMVRFSPRQVRLPPGQSQVIRLMLRKPRDLADGEYRSHMLFQALPPPSSSSIENLAAGQNADDITIELIPIVGVSIPVIVRHGELSSKVSLGDARIVAVEGSQRLALDVERSGTSSAYGDIRVTFTPAGGEPLVVAQVNGVAVYANLDKRRLQIPLSPPAGIGLANGTLDIAFIESGADAESGTLATLRLTLN